MDTLNSLIAKISSGDPAIFYILAGCVVLIAIYFIRRALQIFGIILMVFILFVAWNHFTGNPIPLDFPKEFSLDSVVDYIKKFFDYVIKLLPVSGEDVGKAVGGAVDGVSGGTSGGGESTNP